ncbi:MAG: hypothetical protein ACRDYX_01230 [Egibacteraceae bacterium]
MVIAEKIAVAETFSDWHEPATWPGGGVPGVDDVVTVNTAVRLSRDVEVAELRIEPGGRLLLDPTKAVRLASRGNVVVKGRLTMRPANPQTVHVLSFPAVNEAAFVGGGMAVVAGDVGLWIVEDGILDAVGSAKLAWTRLQGGVSAGASTITVREAPVGWQIGDRIAIVPTSPLRSDTSHSTDYDERAIAGISGQVVTLSAPTQFAHPEVAGRWTAEVLNLSRNVRIEGVPDGKAHVMFLHGHRPQTVAHVELTHLGPDKPHEGNGEPVSVLGRYALHFHFCGDGARGSVVEGVVAHDCGSHAFVPHSSHGITFRSCVAHRTRGEQFWWDPGDLTHDTVWERCLASRAEREGKSFSTTGFFLGAGARNVCRDSVAVGTQGPNSSGYFWNNGANGVWDFNGCLAHNMTVSGIRVWQNSSWIHTIRNTTIYHAKAQGVSHGAYRNSYHYDQLVIHGCGVGIVQTAQTGPSQDVDIDFDGTRGDQPIGQPLRFTGVQVTSCTLPLTLSNGALPAIGATVYRNCPFGSVLIAAPERSRGAWDFVNCGLTPNRVTIVKAPADGMLLRAQDGASAWEMDQSRTVRTIPPFTT